MVHIRRKEPNAMSSSECKKVLNLTIVSASLLMGFSFVNWFFVGLNILCVKMNVITKKIAPCLRPCLHGVGDPGLVG